LSASLRSHTRMQSERRAQPFPGSTSTRQTMSGGGCGCGELTSSCVSQDLPRQLFRGTRFRSSAIIEITYSFDMLKLQTCLHSQTKYVEWREMSSTAWWESKRSSARFPSRIGDGANHRARRCEQKATIIFGEIEKAYKSWLFSMNETIDLRVARTYRRRARTSLGSPLLGFHPLDSSGGCLHVCIERQKYFRPSRASSLRNVR
jgi:hypothetical protein